MKKIKNHVEVLVQKNSFVDKGEGVVDFPEGLTITDNSVQRNGTKYDIESLELGEYKGQVTANHKDTLENIIARVSGIRKEGNSVKVSSITYAIKENPLARLAYNLLVSGFSTDFSIETYGAPRSAADNTFYNHVAVGLSQVVVGNNKSASTEVRSIVQNSLQQSKEDGLDISDIENLFEGSEKKTQENNNKKDKIKMTFVTIKNSRDFEVVVSYKNAAGEISEAAVPAGKSVDVSEDQKAAVEAQIVSAKQSVDVDALIKNATSELEGKVKELQSAFDKQAAEPAFRAASTFNSADSEYAGMSYKERHGIQINSAWEVLKNNSIEASIKLREINSVNLDALKEAKKVENSMTIADFGNFVISPELLTEIQGQRNDYTAIINATDWRETLSLEFAWLKRSGDIDMKNVAFCDDEADGNLKPISEYEATPVVSKLEELAAVTPVCNAATRFLAVDMLGDIARGYRNDYDRKRAQLVIARLQEAVEESGNSTAYNVTTDVKAISNWLDLWTDVSDVAPNGTFIFNSKTYSELRKRALAAGTNGPLANIFITGDVPTVFGFPYIVVPNDLLPTLGTSETVAFEVEGASVTITHGVFFADLSVFTGRTSGGLSYDLSTDAAYEVGGVVKSAYQRNEMVLRGSFFRGGAVLDSSKVSGLLSVGIS